MLDFILIGFALFTQPTATTCLGVVFSHHLFIFIHFYQNFVVLLGKELQIFRHEHVAFLLAYDCIRSLDVHCLRILQLARLLPHQVVLHSCLLDFLRNEWQEHPNQAHLIKVVDFQFILRPHYVVDIVPFIYHASTPLQNHFRMKSMTTTFGIAEWRHPTSSRSPSRCLPSFTASLSYYKRQWLFLICSHSRQTKCTAYRESTSFVSHHRFRLYSRG